MGVPPVLWGVTVGMSRSSNPSNTGEESREEEEEDDKRSDR